MRERWIENELFGLKQELGAGNFARKVWREQAKAKTDLWKSMPPWFKAEAMPYINPNWKPKPKPSKIDDAGIIQAIESAYQESNKS